MFLLLTGPPGQHELWKSDLHCLENWKTKGGTDSDLVCRIVRERTGRDKEGCVQDCSAVFSRAELFGRQGQSLQQRRTLQAMSQEFCLHVTLLQLELRENMRPFPVFLF